MNNVNPRQSPSVSTSIALTDTNMPQEDSGTSTPRSFTGQSASAEDLLKSQTVGLVNLSDFRKRRAEVVEQKEREAHDKSLGRVTAGNSRSATPSGELTDG
jgi:protein FAM50